MFGERVLQMRDIAPYDIVYPFSATDALAHFITRMQ